MAAEIVAGRCIKVFVRAAILAQAALDLKLCPFAFATGQHLRAALGKFLGGILADIMASPGSFAPMPLTSASFVGLRTSQN